MNFIQQFVRKPIYAIALSAAVLTAGIFSMTQLSVRDYPFAQDASVLIQTTFTGADAGLIASFVTSPLESAVLQADGIDYVSSISRQNTSRITAKLKLKFDPNRALAEISANVNSTLNQLPSGTQQPVVTVSTDSAVQAMLLGFPSDTLSPPQIADYVARVVQPRIQAIPGVQRAEFQGRPVFALCAWLDPFKMAALNVSGTDINTALAANNYQAAVGSIQGKDLSVSLTANTGLHTLQDFRQLVIRSENGALVRLSDVAKVEMGSEDYNFSAGLNKHTAVYLTVSVAESANLIKVARSVREAFPQIVADMPEGLSGSIVYDESDYVSGSINEVIGTLFESLAIVAVVTLVMIGSWRSVIVPLVAIPLSLVGTFTVMVLCGFTINLLTLLSLVLAIGLVVDDSIIVLENVHRHIENGITPTSAAIQAIRELIRPIIAMTLVLAAVYAPIGFIGGLTGTLFTEFAVTLVAAVTLSALVALTLSPLMCARVLPALSDRGIGNRFSFSIDRAFSKLQRSYRNLLAKVLRYSWWLAVLALALSFTAYLLYTNADSELAPTEDEGIVYVSLANEPSATLARMRTSSTAVIDGLMSFEATRYVFDFTSPTQSQLGMVLKPWKTRGDTASDLQSRVQKRLDAVSGVRAGAFLPAPFNGNGGFGLQVVIGTTEGFDRLNSVAQAIVEKARASGKFTFIDNDLRFDSPEESIEVDREKAGELGLTMQDVGQQTGTMLSGAYVNYFSNGGRLYQVIPQVSEENRDNAEQVKEYYVKSEQGDQIQLGAIAAMKSGVKPRMLRHFQHLNATVISVVPSVGVSTDQALTILRKIARSEMPQGYNLDYAGEARQFMRESASSSLTLMLALGFIFLLLSVQFQSFRDALIILVSVPLSICGAMSLVSFGVGGTSLNIYTQIGLVTLIGLVSKHGILLVEFANEQQIKGMSRFDAMVDAAGTRLRPILMTTAAMSLGVFPLVVATGAGAQARFNIGLVMLSGVSIGSTLTLFIVPAFYVLFASNHERKIASESTFAG